MRASSSVAPWIIGLFFAACFTSADCPSANAANRPHRLIIETDAGGDPDDEQSLVRFLLYANEWEVEGIIANRPEAREGENRNRERTGLGIVQRLIDAYGDCLPQLLQHDRRYPSREYLRRHTVPGYNHTQEAVALLIRALDRPDPRPIWYSDWGTDNGAATNNLKRALDQLWRERGPAEYARLKRKLRLASYDKFGEHTTNLPPDFVLWVNTFQPEWERRRWYHRFSAITAKAGGFDLLRDVVNGHGPLGALYPTNTTHWQKEGDTMTFLYLVPTGMNDPEHPAWGSWAGRYGPNENYPGKPYYWANQADAWQGTVHRENSLARWAVHLQNDFRARLEWCVKDRRAANHPPRVAIKGKSVRSGAAGSRVELDGSPSADPDGDKLEYSWIEYPEAGTYRGPALLIQGRESSRAQVVLPRVDAPARIHLLLTVTDDGSPPLSRYARVIVDVKPRR